MKFDFEKLRRVPCAYEGRHLPHIGYDFRLMKRFFCRGNDA